MIEEKIQNMKNYATIGFCTFIAMMLVVGILSAV